MQNESFFKVGDMKHPLHATVLHLSNLNIHDIYSYLRTLKAKEQTDNKEENIVIMADEHLNNLSEDIKVLKLKALKKAIELSDFKLVAFMGEHKQEWSSILNIPLIDGKPKFNVYTETMEKRKTFLENYKQKMVKKEIRIEKEEITNTDENQHSNKTIVDVETPINDQTTEDNIQDKSNHEILTTPVIVDKPLYLKGRIRSGQQIKNEGDIIIEGSVHSSAEIISNHNVHIYGQCRGKIMAGQGGNTESSVYIQNFDAEFVSIHNVYYTFERDSKWKGKSVKISLVDNLIHISPLFEKTRKVA